MRRLGIVCCVWLWSSGWAFAQSWLPGSFGPLAAAESAKYTPAQFQQFAGENGALLRELGAQAAERRVYRKDAASVSVVVIQFRDPTGAYGGFELMSSRDPTPSDLAELATISDQSALFAVSNMLVQLEGAELGSRGPEVKALLDGLKPLAKKNAGPFPTLGQYLPGGALPGTRRFVLGAVGLERVLPTGKGDWAGFALGAEVEAARYRMGGREATLLLIAFPTPQVAIAREKALSRWFNVNLTEEVVEGRPVIFTRRMTSLLAVLADARSQKESERLLAKVSFQTELTWNEPTHSATDPPWGVTLYRVFLGTFYFVGFGLAIGLAFALFRLGIKRMFPGKVFDRSENVEILQLGLGSKPIEGKDFYQ